MPTQNQIRQEITNRIIAALEGGLSPWRRPWRVSKNSGRPANVVSEKSYSGVNPLLLSIATMQHGFNSKWWATYRQWAAKGCQVKKRPTNVEPGHWGTGIVFCKPVTKTVTDEDTGDEEKSKFFMLRTYTVFNADQVNGAEHFQVVEEPGAVNNEPDFAPAEELIAATGASIRHGGEQAYYNIPGDFIQLYSDNYFSGLTTIRIPG
jgi:antirestriction protein ArdC